MGKIKRKLADIGKFLVEFVKAECGVNYTQFFSEGVREVREVREIREIREIRESRAKSKGER